MENNKYNLIKNTFDNIFSNNLDLDNKKILFTDTIDRIVVNSDIETKTEFFSYINYLNKDQLEKICSKESLNLILNITNELSNHFRHVDNIDGNLIDNFHYFIETFYGYPEEDPEGSGLETTYRHIKGIIDSFIWKNGFFTDEENDIIIDNILRTFSNIMKLFIDKTNLKNTGKIFGYKFKDFIKDSFTLFRKNYSIVLCNYFMDNERIPSRIECLDCKPSESSITCEDESYLPYLNFYTKIYKVLKDYYTGIFNNSEAKNNQIVPHRKSMVDLNFSRPDYFNKKTDLIAKLFPQEWNKFLELKKEVNNFFYCEDEINEYLKNGLPKNQDFSMQQKIAILRSTIYYYEGGYNQWLLERRYFKKTEALNCLDIVNDITQTISENIQDFNCKDQYFLLDFISFLEQNTEGGKTIETVHSKATDSFIKIGYMLEKATKNNIICPSDKNTQSFLSYYKSFVVGTKNNPEVRKIINNINFVIDQETVKEIKCNIEEDSLTNKISIITKKALKLETPEFIIEVEKLIEKLIEKNYSHYDENIYSNIDFYIKNLKGKYLPEKYRIEINEIVNNINFIVDQKTIEDIKNDIKKEDSLANKIHTIVKKASKLKTAEFIIEVEKLIEKLIEKNYSHYDKNIYSDIDFYIKNLNEKYLPEKYRIEINEIVNNINFIVDQKTIEDIKNDIKKEDLLANKINIIVEKALKLETPEFIIEAGHLIEKLIENIYIYKDEKLGSTLFLYVNRLEETKFLEKDDIEIKRIINNIKPHVCYFENPLNFSYNMQTQSLESFMKAIYERILLSELNEGLLNVVREFDNADIDNREEAKNKVIKYILTKDLANFDNNLSCFSNAFKTPDGNLLNAELLINKDFYTVAVSNIMKEEQTKINTLLNKQMDVLKKGKLIKDNDSEIIKLFAYLAYIEFEPLTLKLLKNNNTRKAINNLSDISIIFDNNGVYNENCEDTYSQALTTINNALTLQEKESLITLLNSTYSEDILGNDIKVKDIANYLAQKDAMKDLITSLQDSINLTKTEEEKKIKEQEEAKKKAKKEVEEEKKEKADIESEFSEPQLQISTLISKEIKNTQTEKEIEEIEEVQQETQETQKIQKTEIEVNKANQTNTNIINHTENLANEEKGEFYLGM